MKQAEKVSYLFGVMWNEAINTYYGNCQTFVQFFGAEEQSQVQYHPSYTTNIALPRENSTAAFEVIIVKVLDFWLV